MRRILIIYILLFVIGGFLHGQNPINGINMKKNSKWASGSFGKTKIYVSWENPSTSNYTERQWVKEAVEATWETYANIDFIGWGKSTQNSRGIRIIIDDYGHPHTKGLGNRLDGKRNGMLLNFNFLGPFKCYGHTREECIKFIAVHEFGHALGLAHEQNRLDCLCEEAPQGGDGDFYVTPCDLNSVMNYCNPKWSNYGKLSHYDKVGIQKIYGQPSGNTNSTIVLDEIRFVPCTRNASVVSSLRNMRSYFLNSPLFQIQHFTEEPDPVIQAAIDNLPNTTFTIRYFHQDDFAKAKDLKRFLATKGYASNSISIENMMPRMKRSFPKYIEIWSK